MSLRFAAAVAAVTAVTAGSMIAIAPLAAQSAAPPATPFDPPRRSELAAPIVDVPLIKSGDFYFVDVLVNDRPLRFTIETGAGFFAIGAGAARTLGLPIDTTIVAGAPTPVARIATLKLGGATFTGLAARVSPLFDGQGFDGIISVPVLHDLLATLDLAGRRLRLERGSLPAANGADILPIVGQDRGGRIDIPVDIGGVTLPAVIDTRSFLWVIAPDSLESRLRLASAMRPIGSAGGPSLGTFQMRGARLDGDMRIGTRVVTRPALVLRDRPGVVLGVPLLEQYVITIDQIGRRVRFSRPAGTAVVVPALAWETGGAAPSAPVTAPGQATMGFNIAGPPGGALSVRNVVAGSDAERVGLKEGDQLVEFDGTPAAAMNASVFRGAAARGSKVKVVVTRDGKRLELEVLPYLPKPTPAAKPAALSDSLQREVRALAAEMVAAFKRDPASTARFYTDDARIMGGGSRYTGRQQVDQYWAQATMFTDWSLDVMEVGGDHESPWMRGRSTLTGQGGRTMATDFIGLLKRGADGRLRFYVDMFTAAAPQGSERE